MMRTRSRAPHICTLRTSAPSVSSRSRAPASAATASRDVESKRSRARGSPARFFSTGLFRPSRETSPTSSRPTTTACAHWSPQGTRRASPRTVPLFISRMSSLDTGAIVNAPSGTVSPAATSRRPASMVSASGTGAAWKATRRSASIASSKSRPAPPAASGSAALVNPTSSSACHNPAGHAPASAASRNSRLQCCSQTRSTVLSRSWRMSCNPSFIAAPARARSCRARFPACRRGW